MGTRTYVNKPLFSQRTRDFFTSFFSISIFAQQILHHSGPQHVDSPTNVNISHPNFPLPSTSMSPPPSLPSPNTHHPCRSPSLYAVPIYF